MDRITDTCKNITLATTSLRPVISLNDTLFCTRLSSVCLPMTITNLQGISYQISGCCAFAFCSMGRLTDDSICGLYLLLVAAYLLLEWYLNLNLLRDKKLKSEQNNMQYPCGTHSDVNGTTLGCNTSGENLTEKDDLYEGTTSTVFSVCIGLIGIFGNSFAVFILFRSAKSGNSKSGKLVNVLLINQSVIDLTASMFLVMMGYNKTESVIVSFSGWRVDLYCKLIGSQLPLWMMSITSSWNLALVNLERYLSIVYPIFHKTGIIKCHTVVSITVVWLIGPTFDFPYIYFTSGYRNGTCVTTGIWPNYTVAVVVGVIGLLVQVLLPLIIMIGLYLSMMKVIRTKIANHTSVNQNSKGNRLTSRTRNILKTLAVVTFIFVVCYAPKLDPLFNVHCRPDRCFKWRFLFFYCIFGICKLLCKSNYSFSSVQRFSDRGEEAML